MNSIDKVLADIESWKKQGIEKAELMALIGEDMIGWPYAWGATGQKCTVANRRARMNNPKIGDGDKNLIKKRCQVLNGSASSCSGCKYHPDDRFTQMRDCIAFVNALLDYAEIDHYGAGCTTMWNHNANWSQKGLLADMPDSPCLVFQRQSKQEPNKMQHIGYYDGKGNVYHCSVEVKKQKLSEYPWTNYAIPKGIGGDVPVSKPTLRIGSTGEYVEECQRDLKSLGYDIGKTGVDGKYGKATANAVKEFQKTHTDENGKPLGVDGICGNATWWALDHAVEPQPISKLYTVHIPHQNEEQCKNLKVLYPDSWATEE